MAGGFILSDGADSDSKLELLRAYLKRLQELQTRLDSDLQLKSAKRCMEDIAELLDPMRNPSEYRLCQDEVIRANAQAILLANTSCKDDALRSSSLETLALLCFGNSSTTEATVTPELLQVLQTSLATGVIPEKLSALQLGQAIAASSSTAALASVPGLVAGAVSLLQDNGKFEQLSQGSLDLLVSCSFSAPTVVAEALGWPQLTQLLAEGESRPIWLPNGPLEILVSGLLVTNCLSAQPHDLSQDEKDELLHALSGNFLGHFVESLQAAVSREAWPAESHVFHSPQRLAEAARKLSGLGFRKELRSAVPVLAQMVQEDAATEVALGALRDLSSEVSCLDLLLSSDDFRVGTLEVLHKSGHSAATDLLAYLEFVEHAFVAGQAAKDLQKNDCPQAPSVLQLAEVFGHFAPLDGKLELSRVPEVCAELPLAPVATVKSSLSFANDGLTLQSFMEHTYGTATILGWWPSLMEESAAKLAQSKVHLPSLAKAAAIFEVAAEGRNTISIQALHDTALPALGIMPEGAIVEAKFWELNGSAPLQFPDFVEWLGELCGDLAEAEAETA
eukprot:CAMPEP_0197651984 /NCGR_PEP_ID=MMETSP1338-20131121/34173_1 /TAXON_ID=43686 ORGANISM="Pelagodinium beii, Strain RCC1491" /NCGR_SAMPLE_ID=MMETSP1338 /ASSEMBLY_ACC=CAM_ASM_000754 /LENGTH=561 /DNA_ID=CAMNT_0043226763 /DNA_START=45 /DNA_END=1727 /DNA_ORIENTATION=+